MSSRKNKVDEASETGRFAYEGLERAIHEKARLGIMTSLATHQKGVLFNDLKELCALTDGNLSRHLAVLQEAGLVEISKGFERNRPQTVCRITQLGRDRYLEYLAVLEQVVRDAAAAVKAETAPKPPRGGLATLQPGTMRSGTHRFTVVWMTITDLGRTALRRWLMHRPPDLPFHATDR